MTRLCTNLPRTPFSLALVARLYRFRWQIELLSKEWKSYANLHKFDTANQHIAAGLIWASLCAAVLKRFLSHAAQLVGGKPISTRRVAMCAGHILDEIVTALLGCISIASAFREGMAFLLANARRSNPKRDRKTGRLRSGLVCRRCPLKRVTAASKADLRRGFEAKPQHVRVPDEVRSGRAH
jgi:hypothetical protein